jgi:hypothetical protein
MLAQYLAGYYCRRRYCYRADVRCQVVPSLRQPASYIPAVSHVNTPQGHTRRAKIIVCHVFGVRCLHPCWTHPYPWVRPRPRRATIETTRLENRAMGNGREEERGGRTSCADLLRSKNPRSPELKEVELSRAGVRNLSVRSLMFVAVGFVNAAAI